MSPTPSQPEKSPALAVSGNSKSMSFAENGDSGYLHRLATVPVLTLDPSYVVRLKLAVPVKVSPGAADGYIV